MINEWSFKETKDAAEKAKDYYENIDDEADDQ